MLLTYGAVLDSSCSILYDVEYDEYRSSGPFELLFALLMGHGA